MSRGTRGEGMEGENGQMFRDSGVVAANRSWRNAHVIYSEK